MARYVCSNNPSHTFDQMTIDGFCPESECYGIGFLVEEQGAQQTPGSSQSSIDLPGKEIGLCILLMDASGSMNTPAFSANPATKAQLVAGSASGGIFDLGKLSNKEDAYIIGIMFDSGIHPVMCSSVEEILRVHSDTSKFAIFLKDKFTYGGTDINGALNFAKQIYDDFVLHGDLSRYGGPKNVKPIKHSILTKQGEQKIVPNIRVLLYTDGEDETTGYIKGNPFKDEETDILMCAFFGRGEEPGCLPLKNITSKCPIHDVDQFFLINEPNRIQTLRKLFRMASGASGFCPVCLAQDK
jgi:hypothetical protein